MGFRDLRTCVCDGCFCSMPEFAVLCRCIRCIWGSRDMYSLTLQSSTVCDYIRSLSYTAGLLRARPCIYTPGIETGNRALSFRLEIGLIFSYSQIYYYYLGLSTILWKPEYCLGFCWQKQSVIVIFYFFFFF